MKLGSGNSMHRRARGGGIPKGAWAPHDDPSGSGWSDPVSEDQINYQKNIIPVIVNVIQDWVTDESGNRVLSEKSGAITRSFVESCISDVNSMLQGTYQPIYEGIPGGQLGTVREHPLHGVACNYQLALANYIPVNYFDNWLYRFDTCVRAPENTKSNSETNGFGVKTPISFDIQNVISGGNSNYQTEFDAAKKALKDSRTKAASNYSTYTDQDMLDIKNYGGLIKTDGIFFYDAEHYYNPTSLVAARTAVGDADATAVDARDPFNALYLDLANGTANAGTDEQSSCNHVTNAFPGLVVWIYDAGDIVPYGSRGNASFPQSGDSGSVWMQGGFSNLFTGDEEDIEYQNTRAEFIGTLLHEFGHAFGLRHAFDGGTVMSLRPTLQSGSIKRNVIPIVQTPAVNETIDVSPDINHLNSQQVDVDTTFDVTKFNTLSSTEKGFIEYYYKKFLPGFTRGVRLRDIVDESKNFSTSIRLYRTTYTSGDTTTIVKSINTAVNSFWDMYVGGENDWNNHIYHTAIPSTEAINDPRLNYDGVSQAIKRLAQGFEASQDVPFFWTGSYHNTITADNPTTHADSPLGGGRQLVLNKTDSGGNLVVNVVNGSDGRTRIPFCIPNADGTPSEDFDEFWMFNMNWLNPDYPPYPYDWPTSKVYDQYEADGSTPLCPCLYAAQTYSKTWVPGTTIQASDVRTTAGVDEVNGNRVLTPVNKTVTTEINERKAEWRDMMHGFLINRDDKDHAYQMMGIYNVGGVQTKNGGNNILNSLVSIKSIDDLSLSYTNNNSPWFRKASTPVDSKSVYANNYTVPFEGGNSNQNNSITLRPVSHKNGFMPEFGFYGFTARTGLPKEYVSTIGPISLQITSNYRQTATTDNVRFLMMNGSNSLGMELPLVIRAFSGSSDPNSSFYNPVKADIPDTITKSQWYKSIPLTGPATSHFLGDTFPSGQGVTVNPLDGYEWRGNALGPGQLRNTMKYARTAVTTEYGEGRFLIDTVASATYLRDPDSDTYYGHNSSIAGINVGQYGGRTVYSKSQIDRMEDVITANRGKLQGALKFGQLISKYHADIVNDYDGFSNARTIKESIEKYLKV